MKMVIANHDFVHMSNDLRFIHRLYRAYLRGPSHPGKLRILRWMERRLFPDRGLPFDVDGGIRQYINPDNEFEYLLLKGGQYQVSLNQFMRQNLNQGNSVGIAGISFGQ